MNTITLETPFGSPVRVCFESYCRCVVRLPDKETEPPTAPLEVKGRAVWGDLVFEFKEAVWQFQPAHRFSCCDYADTHIPVSPGRRTILINTLSQRLGEWCQANPEALEAVYRAVDENRIARLKTEIQDIDSKIGKLHDAKAERQSLIESIRKLRQYVDTET